VTTFAPEAASAILSEVKYWNNASPTTMSSIGTRPTFRTLKRTTAKTTYRSPSRNDVRSIRAERPASRPKALRSMGKVYPVGLGVRRT
jgi:hypothetical protein